MGAGALEDGSARRGIVLGVLAGLAFLTKPSNVVVVGAALVALAVWRRWRAVVATAVTTAAVFSAQIVLNWRIEGNPTRFAYSSAWPYGRTKALASLAYVPRVLGKLFLLNDTGPLFSLAAVAVLVIAWRRYPAMRWLVVAQVVAFTLFFSPLFYADGGTMLRFMTPAVPGLCLAAGCARVRRRSSGVAEPQKVRPPGRASTALAAAGAAGAAGLAVVVGTGRLVPVVPVVPSLVPAAPATLAYRIDRSRSGGSPGREVWGGVVTAMTDSPGPGRWWYQVVVDPGPTPGGWPPGRSMAESVPTLVTVPAG